MLARALPLLLLALVGLVALPTASAATFDLGASKVVERALDPGADAVFEMPLRVNQDGFLYAKVLPTPGNAVNDGSKANGSLADGSGWSVSFAMILASGERVEMGTFVDSTVSPRVPVAIGDTPTFVATVHVPEDAARGGPQQKVYVAIAYRLNDGANAGSNSGGVIDEARALTLVLSNALLPPAEASASPSPSSQPSTDGTETGAGTGTGTGTGIDPEPQLEPGTESGSEPQESAEVPPVAPIQTSPGVQVHVAALPSWFLAGALLLGAALVVVLAILAGAIRTLAHARDANASRGRQPDAREVPVKSETARRGVAATREE